MSAKNSVMKVSLNHISEVFLYEYFVSDGKEYDLSETDTALEYKKKAKEFMSSGNIAKAQQEWIKAHFENPVDMENILSIISCCKQLGDIEGEYAYTLDSYNFCCTRAEMAAYYRNLGWYYLEKYDPDLASVCYMYSQLFDETKQAEEELKFLEKALNKKIEKKSVEDLQKILKKNNIPTEANSVTLALLFKAGGEAESAGDFIQALDCYRMVYDLTQDKEVSEKISKLQENLAR
ncbi:hypothetical protein [Butyrivibrio sp. LC3010]|uniref:hypothetical protein n=1 Tax=Butyrivibrio sp. LC3010 TaxID=1280680 RepID=UPI0003F8FB9A|nr:hypothetical protein [Butyrivibrio sp. LC3010]